MPASNPYHVPSRLRRRYDDIVARTDAIAGAQLDHEYRDLCRRAAAALLRKRPSPIEHGDAQRWAAGIVHAVGRVNFLGDPTQTPHLTDGQLAAAAGVGKGVMSAASRTVSDALGLAPLDPSWTRPSRLLDNPLAWIVLVDGVPFDLRQAPVEVQEAAAADGLIPFVPGPALGIVRDGAAGGAERAPPAAGFADDPLRELQDQLERLLAADPDASPEELDAALAASAEEYNRRPQSDLGGLSPLAVQRLVEADWEAGDSAIRLDTNVPLAELAPSRALADARLLLAMLAERGPVKTTRAGMLPRTFVVEFRERMGRSLEEDEGPLLQSAAPNEPDLFPLHRARALLDLGRAIKRRAGAFSLTRRGAELAADERAGELFALLVRTCFRRLSLGYFDGAAPAPALQHTVGYSLHRFAHVGARWRRPEDLLHDLVLPAVRDELPTSVHFDLPSLVVELRILRHLVALGLAESRERPLEPEQFGRRFEYRKSPLFDRVVRFAALD